MEIDADGNVHARAWIAALRAVQAAGPARVYFTAGQPLDARPAFSTVRKYWLKDEKGTLVPDVTARVFVKPGTRFENIRNVMSFCVYVGIYKIYVGTSAETLVKAFLPVSAGN